MKKYLKIKFVTWLMILTMTVIMSGCGNDIVENEHSYTEDSKEDIIENVTITTDDNTQTTENIPQIPDQITQAPFDIDSIPAYSDNAYVTVNNNIPFFTDSDMVTSSYEMYSELDSKGRCGTCMASIGIDIMPTVERGPIGNVKPSGWHTVKYPGVIKDLYLYNRCHLIGYQLTGENANERNLISGTRYLNLEMLPFENMVADYIKETENHVLYRITPVFKNDNLLADGVLIEAKSVEDDGEGILFCVYCYNVQPGISIDYSDGSSSLITGNSITTNNPQTDNSSNNNSTENPQEQEEISSSASKETTKTTVWIPNSGKKYHSYAGCSNMKTPKEITKVEAEDFGYTPCKKCW